MGYLFPCFLLATAATGCRLPLKVTTPCQTAHSRYLLPQLVVLESGSGNHWILLPFYSGALIAPTIASPRRLYYICFFFFLFSFFGSIDPNLNFANNSFTQFSLNYAVWTSYLFTAMTLTAVVTC